MSNAVDEIQKLMFTGAVDADGHILEDAGLWDRYIEAKYKDRAVRVRTDDKGLEYIEVAGRPSKVFSGGMFGGLSAMGSTRDDKWASSPTYGGLAPFGAMDPKERLKRIDRKISRPRFYIQPSACSRKPRPRTPKWRRPTRAPTTGTSWISAKGAAAS